ncbi:MAG TPA: MarC family protein [Geobacteraceae bacterium]|nr:MarC family protein [Geobacteraceae bacterium]
MEQISTLFIVTFTTLLAMINPLEALPVFLKLLDGKDDAEHRLVARRSCIYATVLMLFFMVFGTLVLKIFGVPLSMVRIVGGIILVRIGFDMFMPSSSGGVLVGPGDDPTLRAGDVAFVPLAMPLMFGPGALATVLGMSAMVKNPIANLGHMAAILTAIVATMLVTYLALAYARRVLGRIGSKGVDAATRLVGFFVSAMGMGLIFHGLIEVLQSYGVMAGQ